MAKAEFLIPRPVETDGVVTREKHDAQSMIFSVYRTEAGESLKWSARFPLPQIGEHIRIRTNGIGAAEVVGFFKEGDFVGVMTKVFNPPKWFKDQRKKERKSSSFDSLPEWRKQGIGCEFGAEIELL